jgi:hypothetical protein
LALVGAFGTGVLSFALASAGAVKVLRSRDEHAKIWLPGVVDKARVPAVITGTGLVEIGLACWIVLARSRPAYAVVALSLCLMTAYGLLSLAASGHCSCGVLDATTNRSLLVRNALLIAIAVVLALSDAARPTILESMLGVFVSTVLALGVTGILSTSGHLGAVGQPRP